jgi:predicted dehydrogenase
MATSVGDAQAMVRAATAAGVTVAAAHTHRSHDYSRAVRAAIDHGDIGRPLLVRLAVLGGWIWGDWNAWVTRPEISGGHTLHNGVHLLDTVRWWMRDEPRRIHARGQRLSAPSLEIYDHLEMTVEFEGGAVAVCEMSRGHRPKAYAARDVLVVGERGVLTLPDGADTAVVHEETGVGAVPARVSNAFLRQLEAWVDGMHGGAPLASAWDGVVSVAMAAAVDESIRSGRAVDLADLVPDVSTGVTA